MGWTEGVMETASLDRGIGSLLDSEADSSSYAHDIVDASARVGNAGLDVGLTSFSPGPYSPSEASEQIRSRKTHSML